MPGRKKRTKDSVPQTGSFSFSIGQAKTCYVPAGRIKLSSIVVDPLYIVRPEDVFVPSTDVQNYRSIGNTSEYETDDYGIEEQWECVVFFNFLLLVLPVSWDVQSIAPLLWYRVKVKICQI